MIPAGFVDLVEAIPGLRAEVRYATAHNLTGHPLAGYLAPRALATRQAAEALQNALNATREAGCGLLVYDAYRPQKAVADFAAWARQPEDFSTKAEFSPAIDKTRLFELGYIAQRSGHSRGSTIDLTLTDPAGSPLAMGTCFDWMGDESHHGYAALPSPVLARRRLLRRLMEAAGFLPYENEWWHYTLAREPFPDKYFDFDIEESI